MADAVTTNVIYDGKDRYVVHLTNVSDGTGESAVAKVDKSTLTAKDGGEPASLDIEQVEWNVQGFTSVRLLWDHTTDDTAVVLSGTGYKDFTCRDDSVPEIDRVRGLQDPRSTGGTGDLLLTTAGTTSGNTYDITIWLYKASD